MHDTDVLDRSSHRPTRTAPTARPARPARVTRSTRGSATRPTIVGTGLQARLAAEWDHLRRRPDAISVARRWDLTDHPVEDLHDILTLAGFEVPRSARCDLVLTRLVHLARTEPLAGRIVLQRLVPGLLAQGRLRRQRGRRDDVFEDLVGAAWITICEYDPARRPSCLAAALIDGADYWAFGRGERRRTVDETSLEPHRFDRHSAERHPSPCDELAAVVRETRADGATDQDLAVVTGLVELGSPSALASAWGVTPRTIRNRRDRITERMRRVALAA